VRKWGIEVCLNGYCGQDGQTLIHAVAIARHLAQHKGKGAQCSALGRRGKASWRAPVDKGSVDILARSSILS
jgi:hypothetical protein